MSALVPLALFGWIPLGFGLFLLMPPRRAVIASLIGGWLFLPASGVVLPGLPDWDKPTAVALVALAGVCVFDRQRLRALRPHWLDAPPVVLCLSPLITALVNGPSAYDGVSAVFTQVVGWGIPYALGRAYCGDGPGATALTRGLVWGGLAYVPVCLYEMTAGPQASLLVYGLDQTDPAQTLRMGGWRPPAFMSNGLMTALWMCAAALAAFALWRGRGDRRCGVAALVLIPMALLSRSLNAWTTLALGLSALLSKRVAWVLVVSVSVAIPTYLSARVGGLWHGTELVTALRQISPARAQSIEYRLQNEHAIALNVRDTPILGQGRGRSPFYDRVHGRMGVPDSLWIIAFAQFGILGLGALTATLLCPVVAFVRRCPPGSWGGSAMAGAGLALVVLLQAVDHMVNASLNPVLVMATGAVAGLALQPEEHDA